MHTTQTPPTPLYKLIIVHTSYTVHTYKNDPAFSELKVSTQTLPDERQTFWVARSFKVEAVYRIFRPISWLHWSESSNERQQSGFSSYSKNDPRSVRHPLKFIVFVTVRQEILKHPVQIHVVRADARHLGIFSAKKLRVFARQKGSVVFFS